jgi:heme exporter protein C
VTSTTQRKPDLAAGPSGLLRPHPEGTGSTGSRIFGTVLLVAIALFLVLALVWSPTDRSANGMGQAVRIMYVHVPVAVACYTAFFITAFASAMYLWKRTDGWDALATASVEVGVVFTALTLATGSIWGHVTWGTWWEWDPRLTSTAVMFVMYLGYLALRSAVVDPAARARRAAVLGLVAFVNVPIVHFSVDWWRSLHQGPTLLRANPSIDGLKLLSLMIGMVLALCVYGWLMVHRFRLQHAEVVLESKGLDVALAERRAEARADGAVAHQVAGGALR